MGHKIFTLSLEFDTTKFAVFDGEAQLFRADVRHDPRRLRMCDGILEQKAYRMQAVRNRLKENGIDLHAMDAFAAYAGGLASVSSGIFPADEKILEDCSSAYQMEHPSRLGAQMIAAFAKGSGRPAYLVNPFDVDEFEDTARLTGLKGVYRRPRVHVVNHKEAAARASKELGRKYECCSLIVCCLESTVFVTAHKQGKIVDGNDILNGEGPMSPVQTGSVPLAPVMEMCYSGEYSWLEMIEKINRTGGLLDLLGTDQITEIKERISEGDRWAKLVFESFAYQISKYIGSYACVLGGGVDAIVLTGTAAADVDLVENVKKYSGWIAPFLVYGGDFELEALASGAVRVLDQTEKLREYTGVPVWDGFDFEY